MSIYMRGNDQVELRRKEIKEIKGIIEIYDKGNLDKDIF